MSFADDVRRDLRGLREGRGLLQSDVGSAIGANTSTISRLEAGIIQATPRIIEAWARACGAEPSIAFFAPSGPISPDPIRAAFDRLDPESQRLVLDLMRKLQPPESP